ncbi:MAG: hypothetical protein SGJ02_00750 [bacterium]|nr:hypothetical protein [bacterium]
MHHAFLFVIVLMFSLFNTSCRALPGSATGSDTYVNRIWQLNVEDAGLANVKAQQASNRKQEDKVAKAEKTSRLQQQSRGARHRDTVVWREIKSIERARNCTPIKYGFTSDYSPNPVAEAPSWKYLIELLPSLGYRLSQDGQWAIKNGYEIGSMQTSQ